MCVCVCVCPLLMEEDRMRCYTIWLYLCPNMSCPIQADPVRSAHTVPGKEVESCAYMYVYTQPPFASCNDNIGAHFDHLRIVFGAMCGGVS